MMAIPFCIRGVRNLYFHEMSGIVSTSPVNSINPFFQVSGDSLHGLDRGSWFENRKSTF